MFKTNDICIVDQNCLLNLKEHAIVKVRIIKRIGLSNYLCQPIEPVVLPCTKDGYYMQDIIVHKRYLTKSSIDEKIVIRCPLNTPVITTKDVELIGKMIEEIGKHNKKSKLIDPATSLIYKLMYYQSLNDIGELK